ncbi:MAG: GNAT family N-acetyltransferase [Lachnospiraceae bacterium]|nr:GNAT family N-acetyltransferase [Lachnospiraceae bacterium]
MIRLMREEEIPVCVALIRRSFGTVAEEFGFTVENAPRFTAFATTEESLTWHLHGEKRPIFVYENENGEIIGYYSLLLEDNNVCELSNLCVAPECRHGKVGEALLLHSYETAKEAGCVVMHIGIVEENVKLRKWYEKYGVVHLGTKKFEHFPFTCGFMEKTL